MRGPKYGEGCSFFVRVCVCVCFFKCDYFGFLLLLLLLCD